MLNIIGGNDNKIINSIQESAPYLDKYEKIGSYSYLTTYRIFATEEVPRVQIYSYDKGGVINAEGSERKEYCPNWHFLCKICNSQDSII